MPSVATAGSSAEERSSSDSTCMLSFVFFESGSCTSSLVVLLMSQLIDSGYSLEELLHPGLPRFEDVALRGSWTGNLRAHLDGLPSGCEWAVIPIDRRPGHSELLLRCRCMMP